MHKYRHTINISRILVDNKIVDHSDVVEPPITSSFSTWLQWIGQRQLQDETWINKVLKFGAAYISSLTVCILIGDKTMCSH